MINPGLNLSKDYSSNHFYDAIASFYRPIDFCLTLHKKPLIQLIQDLPAGKLVSMGVGYAKELSHFQKHQIIGIDYSFEMLKKAKKYNENQPTIHLEQMNAKNTRFQNEYFDYVLISHMLSACDKPCLVMKEASRVLKKGGKIIILNHFTTNNVLQYLDKTFQFLSKFLCFRSHFYIQDIPIPKELSIIKVSPVGIGGYFKIIEIEKENE